MVDSISGNAASRPGRLAAQVSGGREPLDAAALRLEATGTNGPPKGRAANMPALVSEGREAVRRMAAEPPVDSARVSELRQSIASGRYRVDPEKIADAMLRSEPGLLR